MQSWSMLAPMNNGIGNHFHIYAALKEKNSSAGCDVVQWQDAM